MKLRVFSEVNDYWVALGSGGKFLQIDPTLKLHVIRTVFPF